ncbi:hypothetical protein CTI12_AA173100 [Artemisia annua]|uniref:Zinc finger PMZ-type domain-containing protein n=1 Tax=Artemisia annua TaxID=35608 RepID=A0A2U1P6V1_ARTAN|nr:hypothetical protein CTI12_AA173100 [Artemisia annua]
MAVGPDVSSINEVKESSEDAAVAAKMDKLQNQLNQVMLMLQNSQGTVDPKILAAGRYLFIASCIAHLKHAWVCDSGATDHICNLLSLMFNTKHLTTPIIVSLPNGHQTMVTLTGSVRIKPQLTLHNVFYIPSFAYNLLSGTNQKIAHGTLYDGLYIITPDSPTSSATHTSSVNTISLIWVIYFNQLIYPALGLGCVETCHEIPIEILCSPALIILVQLLTFNVRGILTVGAGPFFSFETKCASFENGICESFNRAILEPRAKPLITMLEDIRLYVMQRLVSMNRVARKCEDIVTPSVRKRLNFMMDFQIRYWDVIPSGFQELEVRSGNEAYGVNIHIKKCMSRMWELSGIPCIHAVAAYAHLGRNPEEGVHEWYSQERWFQAYQFSIRPVYGSKMWKRTRDPPLLPPLMRRMPGRLKKNRIIAPSENNTQVSRRGRVMTCTNCQEKGHNKASCKKAPVPKPPKPTRQSKPTTVPDYTTYASARGGGRGSRGPRRGGRGQRGAGRGQRGGGRRQRAGGRSQQPNELLFQEEQRLAAEENNQQDEFDEEAVRLTMEAEERWKAEDLERELAKKKEEEYWDIQKGLHSSCYIDDEESYEQETYNREVASVNAVLDTQESVARPQLEDVAAESLKGKALAIAEPNKRGTKRQAVDVPFRIYHKNRGRSERIFD